jgi:hypothetical protein
MNRRRELRRVVCGMFNVILRRIQCVSIIEECGRDPKPSGTAEQT